jgi:HSP20 family protein
VSRLYAAVLVVARLQGELNRIFAEAIAAAKQDLAESDWQPPIDVVETPKAIVLLAEVPGVSADELRVEARGTLVTLSGVKSTLAVQSRQVRFHCMETGRGRFTRQLRLLQPVDSSRGRATLAQGLLTVEFPKVEDKRRQPRQLAIEEVEDAGHD